MDLKPMQAKHFLLMSILATVSLSGCFGGDDPEPCETHTHDDGTVESHGDCEETQHEECHDGEDHNGTAMDHCEGHGTGTTTTNTSTTPPTPNVLPTPVLTMTDGDGNVLGDNSFILPGMNITFSAVGSTDSDGTIDLIGLTVKDANSTRNAQLMADGNFVDAIFTFDFVGPINVTLRVLDDRGEGVVLEDMAYVDEVEVGSAARLAADSQLLYDPLGSGCTASGDPPIPPLVWSKYAEKQTFNVNAGAMWVSLEATNVQAVAICDADGIELAAGDASTSTEGAEALAPGTQYYVMLHPDATTGDVTWNIQVHYEPKPTA